MVEGDAEVGDRIEDESFRRTRRRDRLRLVRAGYIK